MAEICEGNDLVLEALLAGCRPQTAGSQGYGLLPAAVTAVITVITVTTSALPTLPTMAPGALPLEP